MSVYSLMNHFYRPSTCYCPGKNVKKSGSQLNLKLKNNVYNECSYGLYTHHSTWHHINVNKLWSTEHLMALDIELSGFFPIKCQITLRHKPLSRFCITNIYLFKNECQANGISDYQPHIQISESVWYFLNQGACT